MRTLVHLSDLHFGRVDAELIEPLLVAVADAKPDLVVVSGDLTQRARKRQFEEARAFLDRLPRPQIVVPGNHDVPLYRVWERFLSPLGKYRRIVEADLEPSFVDDEIAVVGINTARSLTFKDGRINEEQMAAIRRRFDPLGDTVLKVVVTHHPFDLPDQSGDVDLVGRAREAMEVFSRCGVDLLLSGHFHVSEAGSTAARARDRRLFGARRPGRHGDLDARPRRGELVQRPARPRRRDRRRADVVARRRQGLRAEGDRALRSRRRPLDRVPMRPALSARPPGPGAAAT